MDPVAVLDPDLRSRLVELAREDLRVRRRLAESGELFSNAYHPEMRSVHDRNARELAAIIEEHGWPGTNLVGPDGAEAAWLVLQHAIGHPELLRRCSPLLWEAAERGEAEPRHAALLEDRIRFFEGRPQRFGTQLDWDESGELSPGPVEGPERVDPRRAEVGLPPLEEDLRRARARAKGEGAQPPEDLRGYRAARRAWAREAGWRSANDD